MSESSREYFDAIGARWESMREGFFTPAVRDAALRCAAVEAGRLAADVGAGTGFVTEALLARGVGVIAVDESEEMLAGLAARFPGAPVECRPGSTTALPLGDGSVDYVFANMVLHHVEDPAGTIEEMTRILRPGGRLVITDLDEHDFEFLAREHHDRWLGFPRDDVRRWLEGAGLQLASVDCVGEECCATSETGQDAAVSIFVASGTKPR